VARCELAATGKAIRSTTRLSVRSRTSIGHSD